ncbi:MscL family protein [Nocardiopsis sp. CNT312]|uniref:MscL family protein n=1 Tax=Nocardiopsis sp. CNT312 TaxID=1137268 RepID=UPI00048B9C78|nr:MscL family protein [Nocardiopsis sp. CNT312]
MNGFKAFLLRGNLVQLAVAVVIGAVFADLVTAFTEGFVTPLIGIFGGVPTFGDLYFEINGSRFLYGAFGDALIAFLITAAVLYFLVVLPVATLLERDTKAEEATTRACPHCRTQVPKEATRCSACTSEISPELV